MYFSDRVTLRTVSTSSAADGYGTESAKKKSIFADRHSISRSEFYAANAAGIKVDIGFTVRRVDYNDETELEWNGKVYNIVRTFEVDSENIDLTCVRA